MRESTFELAECVRGAPDTCSIDADSFIELAECVRGAPDMCSIDADAREVGDAKMSFTAHSYSTPSCAKQLRDVRLKISKILLG